MPNLSPSYDNKIARKYSIKTLDQKSKNKVALQEELKWPKEPRKPVLCIPAGVSNDQIELFVNALPGINTLNMEIIAIENDCDTFKSFVKEQVQDRDYKTALLKNDDASMRKTLAAADFALILDDDNEEIVENCLSYGVVPIAPQIHDLKNYNPVQESGNAFIVEEHTKWHVFAAVVRALETFRFPYDWRTIQRQCMESVK